MLPPVAPPSEVTCCRLPHVPCVEDVAPRDRLPTLPCVALGIDTAPPSARIKLRIPCWPCVTSNIHHVSPSALTMHRLPKSQCVAFRVDKPSSFAACRCDRVAENSHCVVCRCDPCSQTCQVGLWPSIAWLRATVPNSHVFASLLALHVCRTS